MKASDLYFHVAPDFENMEDIIIYITPISYWNDNKCMDDSFHVNPNSNLGKDFSAAGIESCELMEGVYELDYGAKIDDIQDVIESIESVGFQRNKEFSKFLTDSNQKNYIDDDVVVEEREITPKNTFILPKRPFESTSINSLKELLNQAVKKEDYETAAALRDEINLRK